MLKVNQCMSESNRIFNHFLIKLINHICKYIIFFFQVDLRKLRYFYIDEMDAYFVNQVDRDQKLAHQRVYLYI